MTRTHLLTGATGFVGGALALELLERTEDRLICLTRSNATYTAAERLNQALHAAASAYQLEHLLPAAAERCIAVEADLMLPHCGVDAAALGRIDQIWHCAASLQYKDVHREAICATNIDGTAHVVELAAELGDPQLVYVSTAYVAGNRSGEVPEGPETADDHVNNWYERSKVAAESLVRNSGLSDWRIVRPSIVIGHSRTWQATSFTGMYGFLKELLRFDRRVTKELGSFLQYRSLRLVGEPDCYLNFIPIDAVARALASIGLAPAGQERHFHIANTTPPKVRDAIELLFTVVGFATPAFVPSQGHLSSIDERLDKELDFYRSYLRNSKVFQVDATLKHITADGLAWDLEPEALRAYAQWYVDRFRGSARQRPGSEQNTVSLAIS